MMCHHRCKLTSLVARYRQCDAVHIHVFTPYLRVSWRAGEQLYSAPDYSIKALISALITVNWNQGAGTVFTASILYIDYWYVYIFFLEIGVYLVAFQY